MSKTFLKAKRTAKTQVVTKLKKFPHRDLMPSSGVHAGSTHAQNKYIFKKKEHFPPQKKIFPT